LQILARKELIADLKGKSLEPCTDCLDGKEHWVTFKRNGQSSRRKHILELVYTDVYSMTERLLGSALYFGTFIEEHSRKV